MKVCKRCGTEIWTKDGDNLCVVCDLADGKKAAARRRANELRRARADALRSCGLVRVRGALGGTYWE